jgi:hypothetical protein
MGKIKKILVGFMIALSLMGQGEARADYAKAQAVAEEVVKPNEKTAAQKYLKTFAKHVGFNTGKELMAYIRDLGVNSKLDEGFRNYCNKHFECKKSVRIFELSSKRDSKLGVGKLDEEIDKLIEEQKKESPELNIIRVKTYAEQNIKNKKEMKINKGKLTVEQLMNDQDFEFWSKLSSVTPIYLKKDIAKLLDLPEGWVLAVKIDSEKQKNSKTRYEFVTWVMTFGK